MNQVASDSITSLADRFTEQDTRIHERLKILDEFSQTLKANLTRVEMMDRKINSNEKIISDFKDADVFRNAWDNYVAVYQE
jgi:hypothetical protein